MEKVFVHPECPFSVNTFNLLTEFYENPSSDFYMAHKDIFLNCVEDPLNYILSQVEEELPDFIKKYINIKGEKLGSLVEETEGLPSIAYSISLGYEDINERDNAYLMLRFDKQDLTFGFCSEFNNIYDMIKNYKIYYRNNPLAIDGLKGYNLPNQYHCYLIKKTINSLFLLPDSRIRMQSQKSIYELLNSIISWVGEQTRFEQYTTQLVVARTLKKEEVLGCSANQLIQLIVQTFKKVFPLFLCCNVYDNDSPLLINQYFTVYEKKINRVYNLQEISEITGFQTDEVKRWISTINRKKQAIIQGPPGTGKTFIAEKLAKHLIGGDGFSDIIQFHPAYTYEDFIEGIRPLTRNGRLTYSIVPGRFLEFCKQAEACEDTCVLIIDEINRANLSEVFGELMYLLDDRPDTERFIKLASGQKFRIPTNVRILGTMNTADRSIALVDNALRRRFAFIPLYPNYELLQNYHNREKKDFPFDKLISLLKNVNRAINNKHYELGISFFLTKTLAEDIPDIWQMEIEPYLEEYFFDNPEKMDEFLWENIKNKLSK